MEPQVTECLGELPLNESNISMIFSRIVEPDRHAINLLSLIFKQKIYTARSKKDNK